MVNFLKTNCNKYKNIIKLKRCSMFEWDYYVYETKIYLYIDTTIRLKNNNVLLIKGFKNKNKNKLTSAFTWKFNRVW